MAIIKIRPDDAGVDFGAKAYGASYFQPELDE
jgi:hypothetical protein